MKCDFCDKEAIGFVSRVIGPSYCEEHEDKAYEVSDDHDHYLYDWLEREGSRS